jgi:hypothetical protein
MNGGYGDWFVVVLFVYSNLPSPISKPPVSHPRFQTSDLTSPSPLERGGERFKSDLTSPISNLQSHIPLSFGEGRGEV